MQLSTRQIALAEAFLWAEPLNAATLAPSPSPIYTNWIVLTGGVSSGKTTLLREFERRGLSVSHEVARALIERAYQHGLTKDEIFSETQMRQDSIFSHELERHSAMDPQRRTILDAGIGDTLGFRSYFGVDNTAAATWGDVYRYKQVFFLDALTLRNDSARPWDAGQAAHIEREIMQAYLRLGYQPIRVPPIGLVSERADWVLQRVALKNPG